MNRQKYSKGPGNIRGESRNTRWREHFIDALAQSSNVTQSAKEAGVAPSAAYRLRRTDAEFARRWMAALWEGYVHLEMEILRRLREGELQTDTGDKYDFANAIRLLSVHRDNAARAQAEHGRRSDEAFTARCAQIRRLCRAVRHS